MAITAAMVKELRERTGAGMMDCKKALTETSGDMEAAIELMRKSGAAKADKKSGRTAAEGRIVIALNDSQTQAAIVEVNSETDFVAKDASFIAFSDKVAQTVLSAQPTDLDALNTLDLGGQNIEEARANLVAKIGENIKVRRFSIVSAEEGGKIASYTHGSKIGVVVSLQGGGDMTGKDVAMHVAASNPVCVDESGVPTEIIDKERTIQLDIALQSGKPEDIAQKMVDGRMRKFLGEITLVGQPFVKDPDQTVGKLLKADGASVSAFVRFEVGEGIEKKQENFAEEVMAQAKQAG